MKIYITTSDENNHVLPIFSYFFNKYWSDKQEVVFLGFKDPQYDLPNNFSFVSMADKQEGGASEWTTYLNIFFSSISDKHFVFALFENVET